MQTILSGKGSAAPAVRGILLSSILRQLVIIPPHNFDAGFGYANAASLISDLDQVELSEKSRIFTGFSEFDRVLGGGFIEGSVVLLGGTRGPEKVRFSCKR